MLDVMTRREALRSLFVIWMTAACSASPRAAFRPSDPTFVPTVGDKPPVYTHANVARLRDVPIHSVGIIEVSIRGGDAEQRAAEVAANKGQQLGCWAVVEHDAFVGLRAGLIGGATIHFAHGGLPDTHVKAPDRVFKFDCVVRGAGQRA